MFCWFFTCLLCFSYIGLTISKENKIYHVSLDGSNSVNLHWVVDYYSESVIFEIHLPRLDYGWFGIGFSNRGDLFPADYCLLLNNWKHNNFVDTWSDESGHLHLDTHQDCNNFKIKNVNNATKFTFQRKFDTCDCKDYIIEDGTTHVVWMRGIGPVFNAEDINLHNIKAFDKGMVRVGLLKNTKISTDLPSHIKRLDILTDKVAVPAEETTYWCHIFKLTEEYGKKHHIYQYGANIQPTSEGIVHHIEVFRCMAPPDEEIPLYKGSCFAPERPIATQVCKRVLAAWAMGASPFVYPEEASLPIGGQNFSPYVMLEVHYNNPEKLSGIIDSSGIRFYTSTKLKKMDAGVMELGLEYTDKMAIPPGQENFPLIGYCISQCTAVGLPQHGIVVFGSQLHTHLAGVKVVTRHIRNGVELPELNRDNHFSTHFQEIRRLKRPVTILPGDALITRCDYNTQDRQNVTLGGFAISDEMCVNYVHYFPASPLEVCKSSISDQGLATFFNYMNEWENQPTSPSSGISENYQSIEWNKMRVQLLKEVYDETPLSMQCNMSSGDRFPGYWENSPITNILTVLPPPTRKCEKKYQC